ncbi:MAG: molybdopterin-guanine dinucleotide biosynthesis protein A [Candidatus Azotimanducaceae bacterium]|jgi:molybdopterin-guanine dinucleotide biosynthesis protein A
MSTTAILLAGGKGSRMNYRDKAWVEYKDKPLLMHVLDQIVPQVDSVVISRNGDNPAYASLPYRCISDETTDLEGPLAGVMACLTAVTTSHTLVVPCDTPSLPMDLVKELARGIDDNTAISVAHDGKRMQQLIFLARTEALNTISSYLNRGERSVYGWLKTCPHNVITFENRFDNINHEEQLE